MVYVPLADEKRNGNTSTIHYQVIRFTGNQVTAVQMINCNPKNFCYFPARDATLVYNPERKVIEA